MQETRHTTILLTILALLMLLTIPISLRYSAKPMAYASVDAQSTQSSPPYLLRTQGEYLELVGQNGTIQIISSIDPRTLPPHDQKALLEGISITSESALEELLQDFSS